MNPDTRIDRWRLVQDIFQGALELPESERGEYVARACGDDEDLHSEVSSLLANDRDDTRTLHSLVAGDLKGLADGSSTPEIGLRVGPYRLIRELDGGGMGIVYLAVRSDNHYFQIVAIKMVRKGMESPALLKRFRAERQILATLSHPNIGAILDGGDTDDGRPYIVMEYVEGQPITLASVTRGLTIRQRVELFRSVCSAAHYAHQKLVIHRDIKPSNVLVTSEGIVKLIDFGISKPLAPELIPGELAPTEAGQRLLTPDYASPEQLLGQTLTTATDIYSLGVLLFELLTGVRPYTLHDLSAGAAERIVCEQESRRPSSVREISKRMRKQLVGDLDTIVLKAMDKDPFRRYRSADELDQDLLRFLEGKPILAKRATPIYRLRKFMARHKTASFVVGATAVFAAGPILFASLQSRVAEARVKQVQALADSAISDMTEKLQQSSASVELQASVLHGTLNHLDQLSRNSPKDPRLLLSLSRAYRRVGELEGSPFAANLGNSGTAIASYRESLRMAIAAHALSSNDEDTRAVIDAYQRLAALQSFLGDVKAARDNYQQCLSVTRDFWQRKPEDPVRRRLLANSYAGISGVELHNLEANKAVENLRLAFQIFGTEPNGNEDHDGTLIFLSGRMGAALAELGSQSEALASLQRAVTIAEELLRKFPSSTQVKRALYAAYDHMIAALATRETLNVGETRRADAYARKELAMTEQIAAGDGTNAQGRHDLAFAYAKMGALLRHTNRAGAAAWYRKSIALTKDLPPGTEGQRLVAEGDEALAAVMVTPKEARERLHLLQEANSIRQEMARTGPNAPVDRLRLMRSYCRLSDAELSMNHLPEARGHAASSAPFFDEFKVTSPSLVVLRDIGFCYENLGNVHHSVAMDHSFPLAERRAAQAEAHNWYLKSASVWKEWGRRGAATPESEVERHKIERLLEPE